MPHPPRAVVTGASIAGMSTAFWLTRGGWDVTIVERAGSFRQGGQNVDVRGVARDVVERMGLFEAIKRHNTTEEGTVIVDDRGSVVATLPGGGEDGATAELEVLRGDLADVIRSALPDSVGWHFGAHTTAVEADFDADADAAPVAVTLSDGTRLGCDLLVVAEGVRSSTRDLVFGAEPALHEIGVTMAFGTIPRTAADDRNWRWYNATGRRQVHLRPDNHGTTRAILAYAEGPPLADASTDDALARLRERFEDAGWEASRVLEGFEATDDLYIDDLAQARPACWHRGRVVLVGDAAWCVTPIGGGGASLALIGSYVLAAELLAATDLTGGEVRRALTDFEEWMRPLVTKAQRLPPGLKQLAYPATARGLWLRSVLLRVISSRPLSTLGSRTPRIATTDQELPAMPEPRPC